MNSLQDINDFVDSLTSEEIDALLHDPDVLLRPAQQMPDGDWNIWIILAGRG